MSQVGKKGKSLKKSYKQIVSEYNKDEQFLIEMLLLGDEQGYLDTIAQEAQTIIDSNKYPEGVEGDKEKIRDLDSLFGYFLNFVDSMETNFNQNKLLTRNQLANLEMIYDNLSKAIAEAPQGTYATRPKNPQVLSDVYTTMEELKADYDALKKDYTFNESILQAVEDMNNNRVGAYENFKEQLTKENLEKYNDESLKTIITELQKINPKLKGKRSKKDKKIENIQKAMTDDILKSHYSKVKNSQVVADIEGLAKVEKQAEIEAELSEPSKAYAEALKSFKASQKQRKIEQTFKIDKDGNLIYTEATKPKKPVSTTEAVDILNKVLSGQMELEASKNAFKTVKEKENFKGFTGATKMDMLNAERKNFKPTAETAEKALTNPAMMEDIGNLFKVVYGSSHKKQVSLNNFNTLMEDIRKLDRVTNADQLEEVYNILDTMNNKQYQNNLAFSNEISQETSKPVSISQFGEVVKTKPVSLKDIPPPKTTQLKEVKEALRQAQKAYDIQEVEGFEDLEEQQEALRNIQTLEDTLRKLQPEAKKEQQKKKKQEVLATQGEKAKGAFRPHFVNITEKLINEELNKTPQEVLKERSNWALFDVPDSYTGTGNIHDNPLLRQIEQQDNILSRGLNFDCWQESYQLHEGIFERKDFWHSGRPVQTSEQRKQGIKDNKFKEEEEAYLAFFNSGDNALFPQQQTRKEQNDFKNIYQKPSRFIGGSQIPEFQDTNNQGIKYTDKEWVNNLNLFINP